MVCLCHEGDFERTLVRLHVDVEEQEARKCKIALRHDNIVQVLHVSSHQGNGGEILVFPELCSDITPVRSFA